MNHADEQLVQRIAQQVIEQMTRGNANPPAAGTDSAAEPTARTRVRPAAGVCTGDYAQFKDRPDLVESTGEPAGPVQAADRTFTGIVTARQIRDSGLSTVRLAPGAQLTPLAADHVRSAALTVERAAESPANGPARAGAAGWLWWIDGHCDAVRQLAGHWPQRLSPLAPLGHDSALADVVRRAARSVSAHRHAGAILFVHSAARAACYANRCPSLRAVVGTCGEAVQQGIDLLAANVLIIEYPHHGAKSMRTIVEQFIGTGRPPRPHVDRQLRELASCD
ncbi:MAG: hypothetical protein GVY24_03085 [Planctomycetes bacterium]|jgi:hypothetical protein|nr:hypothetical protein [Planctomycetota bacterium]